MHAIDILNWLGYKRGLKPFGRLILAVTLSLGLARLLRIAGRRVVSASAGAPGILLTHGDIEMALKDPQLLYDAMEFTVREMKLDTFCLVADLSLEAEACGCQIQFRKRDLPAVTSHPVRQADDVEKLRIPDPHHDGRMPVILETVRKLKDRYSMIKVVPVTGPFTLAMHLCGAPIFVDTIKDPEKVTRVLEFSERVVLAYTRALIATGADMIIVAEPIGSQLSKKAYDRFSQPYTERIARALSKPCMLHICGKTGHLIDSMCESSYVAISVDEVDMSRLIKHARRNTVLVGNLSPLRLLHASPADIGRETTELLKTASNKREFLVAPGCDLAPETPLANILAFVNTVRTSKSH